NQSAGPFVDGCEPLRLISIENSFRWVAVVLCARSIAGVPSTAVAAAPTTFKNLRRRMRIVSKTPAASLFFDQFNGCRCCFFASQCVLIAVQFSELHESS